MSAELGKHIFKIALASLVMGAVIIFIWARMIQGDEIWRLVMTGLCAAMVFIGMCFVLKVDQIVSIQKRFRLIP